MYYGLRCYNKDGEALGWLYTYNDDTELVWTIKNLDWCKRWKTERGSQKNFDRYHSRWQFKSKGGFLKIEVMPDIQQPDKSKGSASKLLEEWGEDENVTNTSVLSFHPSSEIFKWLEEERLINDRNEAESDDALINRKLDKLRKLEQQRL
jgi:hypothetical protein